MHLVQLGKLRHGDVRILPALHSSSGRAVRRTWLPAIPSPGALPLLVLAAAAPLPFLLKLPGDSTPAAPGQVSGS